MRRVKVLTSNRAVSLQVVANDITKVGRGLGLDIDWAVSQMLPYEVVKGGYSVITVMAIDPLIARAWMYLSYEYTRKGVPNIFYGTCEGSLKTTYIDYWMKDINFIAVSNYVCSKLKEAGLPCFGVIHHGIDLEFVNKVMTDKALGSKLLSKPSGTVMGLVIASSHVRKGLKFFDKVLEVLEKKEPSFKVTVVTEPKSAVYFGKRSNLVLNFNFGKLSRLAILSLIKQADIVILPSLAEGFGLPVLEGMAFLKPVVHTDLPPLREFSTGWAVPVSQIINYNSLATPLGSVSTGINFEHFIYEPNDFAEVVTQVVDIVKNKKEVLNDYIAKTRKAVANHDIKVVYKKLINLITHTH